MYGSGTARRGDVAQLAAVARTYIPLSTQRTYLVALVTIGVVAVAALALSLFLLFRTHWGHATFRSIRVEPDKDVSAAIEVAFQDGVEYSSSVKGLLIGMPAQSHGTTGVTSPGIQVNGGDATLLANGPWNGVVAVDLQSATPSAFYGFFVTQNGGISGSSTGFPLSNWK